MNRTAFIALVILGLALQIHAQTNEKGVLAFDSFEHLDAVQTKLQSLLDEYYRNLVATQSDIDKYIEDKNPCPWDPYIRWSQSLAFTSLLEVSYKAQAAWLQSKSADDETTEPRGPFISNPEDQAVLNEFNEIKIGNVYYRLSQGGQETYDTLDALIASRRIATTSIASTLKRRLQTAGCSTNWWNSGYYYCQQNLKRRTKFVVAHYWWFFKYRAHASTQCYKKGFLGIWWWSWNDHLARAYGAVSNPIIVGCNVENNLCKLQYTFNTLSTLNYNQHWGFWTSHNVCVPTKTASGWVHGQHRSSCCDATYYSTLYF